MFTKIFQRPQSSRLSRFQYEVVSFMNMDKVNVRSNIYPRDLPSNFVNICYSPSSQLDIHVP